MKKFTLSLLALGLAVASFAAISNEKGKKGKKECTKTCTQKCAKHTACNKKDCSKTACLKKEA